MLFASFVPYQGHTHPTVIILCLAVIQCGYGIMITGKGNISIDKVHAKRIENGKIVKELPLVSYLGALLSLFSVVSPCCCPKCGSKLNCNKSYNRYILSHYGVLEIPVTYWECSNRECNGHYADIIVGVDGSRNYCEEYLDIQYHTRYEGKCSLFNNRRVGEIYTEDGDYRGRAACPATLWKYEQNRGKVSLEELQSTDVPFDGNLYCDGYWVKDGWRKFVEERLGRELTDREWKTLRYKVIYVIATRDKVILDFVITDTQPSFISLIPLFSRVKNRMGEENIKRVVSDEEWAIIDAVSHVLPNATHAFCVFHQLKHLTKIYLDMFKKLENIPYNDKQFYEKGNELILADNCILSSAVLSELEKLFQNINTEASQQAMAYLQKIYHQNRKLIEKGFVPETNNVMEQLFSFINDFVYQARSFKIVSGLRNWAANMFSVWNHRKFNTGNHRGESPLDIAWGIDPG